MVARRYPSTNLITPSKTAHIWKTASHIFGRCLHTVQWHEKNTWGYWYEGRNNYGHSLQQRGKRIGRVGTALSLKIARIKARNEHYHYWRCVWSLHRVCASHTYLKNFISSHWLLRLFNMVMDTCMNSKVDKQIESESKKENGSKQTLHEEENWLRHIT